MAQVVATSGKTFEEILEIVAKIAEVEPDAILSKNRTTEVVDARHALIQLLAEQDWCSARIARKLCLSEGTVSRTLDHFHDRCKYGGFNINNILKNTRENIKK